MNNAIYADKRADSLGIAFHPLWMNHPHTYYFPTRMPVAARLCISDREGPDGAFVIAAAAAGERGLDCAFWTWTDKPEKTFSLDCGGLPDLVGVAASAGDAPKLAALCRVAARLRLLVSDGERTTKTPLDFGTAASLAAISFAPAGGVRIAAVSEREIELISLSEAGDVVAVDRAHLSFDTRLARRDSGRVLDDLRLETEIVVSDASRADVSVEPLLRPSVPFRRGAGEISLPMTPPEPTGKAYKFFGGRDLYEIATEPAVETGGDRAVAKLIASVGDDGRWRRGRDASRPVYVMSSFQKINPDAIELGPARRAIAVDTSLVTRGDRAAGEVQRVLRGFRSIADRHAGYAMRNPVNAAYAAAAAAFAMDRFTGAERDDVIDAQRHALWAALLCARLGSDEAAIVLGNHEQGADPNADPKMDAYNNRVGIHLGREYHRLGHELAGKIDEILAKVRSYAERGLLYHKGNTNPDAAWERELKGGRERSGPDGRDGYEGPGGARDLRAGEQRPAEPPKTPESSGLRINTNAADNRREERPEPLEPFEVPPLH